MRKFILSLICCILITLNAFGANYELIIDGKTIDIEVGKTQSISIGENQTISVTLKRKEIVTYSTEHLSFRHHSKYQPSRTDLGDGIYQNMFTSPLGTLVLIQEYTSIDPSNLIDMMIKELTKEEAKYGYNIKINKASKVLSDGTKLNGKSAISKYKNEENTKYVLCFQSVDSGILLITQIDKDNIQSDSEILDLFWKTLQIKMK